MEGRILVTGSEGLVGSRFVELFPEKDLLHFPKRIEFDITNPSQIKAILSSFNISAVINFAAFTDVAEAEKQRGDKKGDCWITNVDGVANLISAIDPTKTHFVQISSNSVFAGTSEDPGPYMENHPIETEQEKLTWCGFAKAEAERIVVQELGEKATILRLNNPVRSHFEGKLDYIRHRLKLYDQKKLHPLLHDQQIAISYINEVCKTLEKIILGNVCGTFHASSSDTTTPHELMTYVLGEVRGVRVELKSMSLKEFYGEGADS